MKRRVLIGACVLLAVVVLALPVQGIYKIKSQSVTSISEDYFGTIDADRLSSVVDSLAMNYDLSYSDCDYDNLLGILLSRRCTVRYRNAGMSYVEVGYWVYPSTAIYKIQRGG